MPEQSLVLTKPLLQEAAPRSVRCSGKVLMLLSMLIGLGFAAVLSDMHGQHMKVQTSSINMYGTGMPFDPEALPERTNAGRVVAYQYGMGNPWRLFGRSKDSFTWVQNMDYKIGMAEKDKVKADLGDYASKHGIKLQYSRDDGEIKVKIALLNEDNVWVSYHGGVGTNPLKM